MKITDIILVMDNHKGTERNFLCTFEGFVKNHLTNACDSYLEVAEMVQQLDATKDKFGEYCEIYFATNKTMYAKYCSSVNELQLFLLGKLNDGVKHSFEESFCDSECLDAMERMGIDKSGAQSMDRQPHYERLDKSFEQGEVLHNFNGSDYRVLEKLSARNLLLMDVGTGNFTIGIGVDYFARYPKDEDMSSELCEKAIEWGHGVYLGCTPSLIDFKIIRQEYGEEKEIKSIEDYRQSLKEQFNSYYALAKDESVVDSVKSAAAKAMYEEFGTGKSDNFYRKLENGDYDGAYLGAAPQQKYRGR